MKKSKGAAKAPPKGGKSTWKKVSVSDAILQGSDEFGFVELEEMNCPVIFKSAADAPKAFLRSLASDGVEEDQAGRKGERAGEGEPASPTKADLLAEVTRLKAENAALAGTTQDANKATKEKKKKKKGKKKGKEEEKKEGEETGRERGEEKKEEGEERGREKGEEKNGAAGDGPEAPSSALSAAPSTVPSSASSSAPSGGLSRAQKRAARLRAIRERKKAEIAERKRKRSVGDKEGDGGEEEREDEGGDGGEEEREDEGGDGEDEVPALVPQGSAGTRGGGEGPGSSAALPVRAPVDPSAWEPFGLHPTLVRALGEMGFAAPTEIQALVIPPAVRDRRDVIGAAQTGSGKTLAFGLPILHRIANEMDKEKEKEKEEGEEEERRSDGEKAGAEGEALGGVVLPSPTASRSPRRGSGRSLDGDTDEEDEEEDGNEGEEGAGGATAHGMARDPLASSPLGMARDPLAPSPSGTPPLSSSSRGRLRALVLTPTRELALQVTDHLTPLARAVGAWVVPIVGGMSPQKQRRLLARLPEVVVATPGRLWELVEAGEPHVSDFSGLEYLVVDEADRMCQKGRYEELTNVVKRIRDAFRSPGGGQGAMTSSSRDPDLNAFEGWTILDDRAMAAATREKPTEEQNEDEEQEQEQEEVDMEEVEMGETGEEEHEEEESNKKEQQQEQQQQEQERQEQKQEQEQERQEQERQEQEQEQQQEQERQEQEQSSHSSLPLPSSAAPPPPTSSASKKSRASRLPGPAVMVFSATLTLPTSLRSRLRRGGGGASGSADLQSLIDRLPFADPRPFVADRSARAGLGANVREARIECAEESRDERLYELLARTSGRSLVFVNAISAARRLSSLLKALGLPVTALHGGQQQRARLRSLDAFKKTRDGVLVATDVAARGLDVPDVDLVAHYQLPASLDAYVHRSGRTARGAGDAEGLAVAIVTPQDLPRWRALRRALRDAGLEGDEEERANGTPKGTPKGTQGPNGTPKGTPKGTAGPSTDLPEPPLFPLDPSLAPAARERVRLAARVEAAERTLKKAAADAAWERTVAEQIDQGDDDREESATKAKAKTKKAKRKSDGNDTLSASARLFEGEDADGVPLSRKHRAAVDALRRLKEELADLLAAPLQPKYSHKYFVGGAAAGAARAGDAAAAAGRGVQLAAELVLAKKRAAEQASRARGGQAAPAPAARTRAAPPAPVSRAQALQMAVSKELERRAAKRGRSGNPAAGPAGAAGGRRGRKKARLPTALPRGGAPTALAVMRGQGKA